MPALAYLLLVSAVVSFVLGNSMLAFGFLIVGGAAASWSVAGITRVHGRQALSAHLLVRVAAAVVLGIFTVKAAHYPGVRYGGGAALLLLPGMLAVLSFASAFALVWFAVADSGASLCRVGVHRWLDIWSETGPHRECAQCGVRATTKRRAIGRAARLGACVFALVLPAAALAAGVYAATRLPPNYSLARSTACWRAHGYRVSRPHHMTDLSPEYRGFLSVDIRGHHDHQWAVFTPDQAVAWSAATSAGEGFYNPDYGNPSVPVRNVIFAVSDEPILACLRPSED